MYSDGDFVMCFCVSSHGAPAICTGSLPLGSRPPKGPSTTGHRQRKQFQSDFLPVKIRFVFVFQFILNFKNLPTGSRLCYKCKYHKYHTQAGAVGLVSRDQSHLGSDGVNAVLPTVGSNLGTSLLLRVVQGRLKEQ